MPSYRLNVGDIVSFTAHVQAQMSLGVEGRYARVGQLVCSAEDGDDIIEVKGWFGSRASLEEVKILHVIWRMGRRWRDGVHERTIEEIERNGLCLASGVRISNHTFMENAVVKLKRVASRLFPGRAPGPAVLFATAIVLNCDASVTQVDPNPNMNPYEMFYMASGALGAPTPPAVEWYTFAQAVYSGDIEVLSSNVAHNSYMDTITCLQNCSSSPHDARGMITYEATMLGTLAETKHFYEADRKKLSMCLMNFDITPTFAANICRQLGIKDTFDKKVLMAAAMCLEDEARTDQIKYAEAMFFEGTGRADEDAGWRRSFKHHKVYSIQSENRSGGNVAFSIGKFERPGESVGRRHPDCVRDYVFVHISDVTRYIGHDLNSPLLRAAMGRARTHFLPTGNMTMLPKDITRMVSMADWRGSCTVTVRFSIAHGKISEFGYQIYISRISKPKILSYEEAEEQIQAVELNDVKRIYDLVRNSFPEAVQQEEQTNSDVIDVNVQEDSSIFVSPRVHHKRAFVLMWALEKVTNVACTKYGGEKELSMCIHEPVPPEDPDPFGFAFHAETVPDDGISDFYEGGKACALVTLPAHCAPDLINQIQLKAQLRLDAQRQTHRRLTKDEVIEEIGGNKFKEKYCYGLGMESRMTQYYLHKFLSNHTQKTVVGTMLGYPSQLEDMNPYTAHINNMAISGCATFRRALMQLDISKIPIFAMVPCGLAPGLKVKLVVSWVCADSMRHDAFAIEMA